MSSANLLTLADHEEKSVIISAQMSEFTSKIPGTASITSAYTTWSETGGRGGSKVYTGSELASPGALKTAISNYLDSALPSNSEDKIITVSTVVEYD